MPLALVSENTQSQDNTWLKYTSSLVLVGSKISFSSFLTCSVKGKKVNVVLFVTTGEW